MANPGDADTQKLHAAERALDYLRPGMKLGLGTGSTAAKFIDLLGARVKDGLEVVCVPTSETTRAQAEALNIPLTTLDRQASLDLTVDGADELNEDLQLVKGGGGALLREKIVAAASDKMVVIADASKLVDTLGAFPLPIEIDRFGVHATQARVERAAREIGCEGTVRLRSVADEAVVTDGGNHILDCWFGAIQDPAALGAALSPLPGVLEHGLFLGLATTAIVAGPQGVKIIGETP
jgi:ribose 5-phosphate isomerase A